MIRTHLEIMKVSSSVQSVDPVILCAADDAYAMPLATTLKSIADHLAVGSMAHVYLVDAGISESSWMALKETIVSCDLQLNVIQGDPESLQHLQTSHHISHAAYFRLLAAELLPENLDRVIYIDSDMLVRDDISQLWNLELADNYCLAVPDIACPFVDARYADCNFRHSSPYMAVISPIRNWQQLGLDGSAPYFNSGLMVINLKAWRRDKLSEQFLQCLEHNKEYVWCWDQYALNVVMAGRWKTLPMRWNQGAHVFEYPDAKNSPVASEEFESMKHNPAIIHFTTEFKPWHDRSDHPLRDEFFRELDTTAWQSWRPTRESFSIRRWWDRRALAAIRHSTIAYRKLATMRHSVRSLNSVQVDR